MKIGNLIKKRREELGMSQEELATKLGYKSRSSINKIELGKNDITQHKVVEFARVLQTTPSYLMGWITEEASTKNNTIANIVKDLRTDDMFLSIVEKIYNMDNTQRSTINQMLSAFEIKKE
jgi:transcriptional regulator with XRE-family HTH domain